jgi:hypothetical protein
MVSVQVFLCLWSSCFVIAIHIIIYEIQYVKTFVVSWMYKYFFNCILKTSLASNIHLRRDCETRFPYLSNFKTTLFLTQKSVTLNTCFLPVLRIPLFFRLLFY